MKVLLNESIYNFALASHTGILSKNSASTMSIASGQVSTDGPGVYVFTTPRLPGFGQDAWGNAKLYLAFRRLNACTLKLGISNGPNNFGGKTITGGDSSSIYSASEDINALAFKENIRTLVWPAIEITTSSSGTFLDLYNFKCEWLTTELLCNG